MKDGVTEKERKNERHTRIKYLKLLEIAVGNPTEKRA